MNRADFLKISAEQVQYSGWLRKKQELNRESNCHRQRKARQKMLRRRYVRVLLKISARAKSYSTKKT